MDASQREQFRQYSGEAGTLMRRLLELVGLFQDHEAIFSLPTSDINANLALIKTEFSFLSTASSQLQENIHGLVALLEAGRRNVAPSPHPSNSQLCKMHTPSDFSPRPSPSSTQSHVYPPGLSSQTTFQSTTPSPTNFSSSYDPSSYAGDTAASSTAQTALTSAHLVQMSSSMTTMTPRDCSIPWDMGLPEGNLSSTLEHILSTSSYVVNSEQTPSGNPGQTGTAQLEYETMLLEEVEPAGSVQEVNPATSVGEVPASTVEEPASSVTAPKEPTPAKGEATSKSPSKLKLKKPNVVRHNPIAAHTSPPKATAQEAHSSQDAEKQVRRRPRKLPDPESPAPKKKASKPPAKLPAPGSTLIPINPKYVFLRDKATGSVFCSGLPAERPSQGVISQPLSQEGFPSQRRRRPFVSLPRLSNEDLLSTLTPEEEDDDSILSILATANLEIPAQSATSSAQLEVSAPGGVSADSTASADNQEGCTKKTEQRTGQLLLLNPGLFGQTRFEGTVRHYTLMRKNQPAEVAMDDPSLSKRETVIIEIPPHLHKIAATAGIHDGFQNAVGAQTYEYIPDMGLLFLNTRKGEFTRKKVDLLKASHLRDLEEELKLETTANEPKFCEEFEIVEGLVGLALGKRYSNILAARKIKDVTNVRFNENTLCIQVCGKTAEAVKTARNMLEYKEHYSEIPRYLAEELLEDDGKIINEIVKQSGLVRIESGVDEEDDDENEDYRIVFVGNPPCIDNAKALLEYQLKLIDRKLKKKQSAKNEPMNNPNLVTERVPIKQELKGLAVGKNYENVKKAEKIPGVVKIDVPHEIPLIIIHAESLAAAKTARGMLEYDEDTVEVSHKSLGKIIGKGGVTIKKIESLCEGVRIRIPSNVKPEDLSSSGQVIIRVSGLVYKIQMAIHYIKKAESEGHL